MPSGSISLGLLGSRSAHHACLSSVSPKLHPVEGGGDAVGKYIWETAVPGDKRERVRKLCGSVSSFSMELLAKHLQTPFTQELLNLQSLQALRGTGGRTQSLTFPLSS